MRLKIIKRHLDRQSLLQTQQMINKHVAVERVRMIEICLLTLVERHIGKIAVIRILLDKHHFSRTDRFDNSSGYRRFPRPSSAANSDYHKNILTG